MKKLARCRRVRFEDAKPDTKLRMVRTISVRCNWFRLCCLPVIKSGAKDYKAN